MQNIAYVSNDSNPTIITSNFYIENDFLLNNVLKLLNSLNKNYFIVFSHLLSEDNNINKSFESN
jgi:hypothetical protein